MTSPTPAVISAEGGRRRGRRRNQRRRRSAPCSPPRRRIGWPARTAACASPHRLRRPGHQRPPRHAAARCATASRSATSTTSRWRRRRTASTKEFNQTPELTTRDFRRVLDRTGHRRGDRRHARSLARAADRPGLPGRQGRLRREAARADHRRRAGDGQRRAPHNRVVQMGTQQRSATHFRDAVEYVKSGALGKIRLVKTWAYQDWMGNIAPVPDSDAAADGRLRHVARPGAEAAVQREPLPLQLPLVLRLLRRPDDRLGRAHDRHRQLGRWASRRRRRRPRSAASSASRTMRRRRRTRSRRSGSATASRWYGSTRPRSARAPTCATTASPSMATTACSSWTAAAGKSCRRPRRRTARRRTG